MDCGTFIQKCSKAHWRYSMHTHARTHTQPAWSLINWNCRHITFFRPETQESSKRTFFATYFSFHLVSYVSFSWWYSIQAPKYLGPEKRDFIWEEFIWGDFIWECLGKLDFPREEYGCTLGMLYLGDYLPSLLAPDGPECAMNVLPAHLGPVGRILFLSLLDLFGAESTPRLNPDGKRCRWPKVGEYAGGSYFTLY